MEDKLYKDTKHVAAKMLAVMGDVGYVKKDGKNTFQNYSYVSEADTIATVRQAMCKHGLVATPVVTSHSTIEAGATKSGAKQWFTTILVEYTFTDPDSGESLLVTTIGQGMDTGDKGCYKAMAGANKYALLKAFQIATGDDDPEKHSPEVAAVATPAMIDRILALEKQAHSTGPEREDSRHKHEIRINIKETPRALIVTYGEYLNLKIRNKN